jgi:hypothetical protein
LTSRVPQLMSPAGSQSSWSANTSLTFCQLLPMSRSSIRPLRRSQEKGRTSFLENWRPWILCVFRHFSDTSNMYDASRRVDLKDVLTRPHWNEFLACRGLV